MAGRRYYKDIRFEHFRTFSTVARVGSFAAAGRQLGLSRPTIWQQMDALERDFDVPLFRRVRRGVELTAEGRLLLELVQPSVAAFDSVREAFRARLADQGGVLQLAHIRSTEMMGALRRYREQHPRVQLSLAERQSSEIVRMLETGSWDLGIALVSAEMALSPLVHYELASNRAFTLLTPIGHPLARKRSLRLDDIVKYPIITFLKDTPFRRHLERGFDRAGLLAQLQVAVEADRVATAEECVQMGMGVAIVLPARTSTPTPQVAYRSLAVHFGQVPVCVLWEKGKHLLPHVAAFVRLVSEGSER